MKWKHLRPIASLQPHWLAGNHLDRVRRVCSAVRRRTGADAWVDVRWAQVCFGYEKAGDVSIALSCELFKDKARRAPDFLDPALSIWNEDNICYLLQIARVDPRRKAHWARMLETSRKSDEANEKQRGIEDAAKLAMRQTERAYQAHTMGRHYKGRAVVAGLKGLN